MSCEKESAPLPIPAGIVVAEYPAHLQQYQQLPMVDPDTGLRHEILVSDVVITTTTDVAAVAATSMMAPPLLGPWSTGLFGCFQDPRSMADAMCCKLCQTSRQYNVLANGSNDLHIGAMATVFGAALLCGGLGLAPCAMPMFVAHVRRMTRERYGIEGSNVGDAAAAVFCEPCAIAQHYREMSVRGDWCSGEFVSRPFALPAAAKDMEMV